MSARGLFRLNPRLAALGWLVRVVEVDAVPAFGLRSLDVGKQIVQKHRVGGLSA